MLLVDEGDEAQGQFRMDRREEAGELEKGGDACPVVVRTRAAGDRVVMRAEEDDLTLPRIADARDL
jgi:hypothetical protein